MNDLMIASSKADARAAEAVEEHHAAMAGSLALKVEILTAAVRAGHVEDADEVRQELLRWCREDLVPHALAEERTLYAAAVTLPEARLLIEAMLAEHRFLTGLVDELADAPDPVSAAGLARALRAVFETHLAKENEQVLPLLVAAPDISVSELLDGMHELLGGDRAVAPATDDTADDKAGAPDGHACGCGEIDPSGYPELDARAVPHAIRHATIFGALDGVRRGKGLVLLAPHDPLPMLAQLERREPGTFDVEYLERGPEVWRLAIVRRAG